MARPAGVWRMVGRGLGGLLSIVEIVEGAWSGTEGILAIGRMIDLKQSVIWIRWLQSKSGRW